MYDFEKIKNICILGDGASWIKAEVGIMNTSNTRASFALDKFHFHQSLTRIEKDKEIRKRMVEAILIDNNKCTFKNIADILIESAPNREISIQKEKTYIRNHWGAIQRSYHEVNMGCSMESAISHCLASTFTSEPKGYKR